MSSSSSITRYELLKHPHSTTCNQLKKCESLKRIEYILEEYHKINKQTSSSLAKSKLIIECLSHYKHLINDYHHLLTKHLSHSNHSTNIQNFNYIHSKITACDINECQVFIAHYKYESQLIPSTTNRIHSFHLQYLRGIHIHFAHALDVGLRSHFTPNIFHSDPKNNSFDQDLINQLLLFNFGDRDDIINAMRIARNQHDVNEVIDILKNINAQKHKRVVAQLSSSEFYEDSQMRAIQNHIQNKRERLLSICGSERMKRNKFTTNIATSTKTFVTQKPRRASRKMNKLLPDPKSNTEMETQTNTNKDIADIEEIEDGARDTFTVLLHKHLIQNGIAIDILDAFNEWRLNTNYDTDGIIQDIDIAVKRGDRESNIHQFCRLKNRIKCFNIIKHFVASNAANLAIVKNEAVAEAPKKLVKVANMEKSAKVHNVKRGSKEYVFGQRFYYWPTYKTEAWFLQPKYASFKEEILSIMDVNQFQFCFTKATQLKKGSDVIKAIRSNRDGQKLGYSIDSDLALSVANLLSIIFYTDYDVLSANFKGTFYKLTCDESDSAQKKRHSVYWYWSKILTETIECYGTQLRFNKIDKLYHNTTFMYYSLFTSTFNAPTSMTRYIEVAAMYCEQNGIILEMGQYPKIRPKYFDCSLVSAHAVEHELLFIAGDKAMDISSIRVIKSNEDYQAFIKAMRLFNKVTRATILSQLERCEITESDYIIIRRLIQNNNNFPKYINESFRRCCSEKKRIRMDCYCLRDKRYYYPYASWFMHAYHMNLLRFDYICKLFPNTVCIESWDTGTLSSLYWIALKNMLITMNKMGDEMKLKKIIIHCDPLDVCEFSLQKHIFKQQKWIIRMIEPYEIVLFKMGNKS